MKTQTDINQEFLEQVASLMPVAKGCLTKNRCGHMFMHRHAGKYNCMYIRPEFVPAMQTAIANGRKLQALIIENGIKLVNLYREDPPMSKLGRPKKIIDVQPEPKHKPGRPKKIKYEF